MRMPTVAFGPISAQPSWRWVGFDTARELGKYFRVRLFDWGAPAPKADLFCFVKRAPSEEWIRTVRRHGAKLVYAPVDWFQSEQAITACGSRLGACDLILAHCERLITYFQAFAPAAYVDHHGKYTLAETIPYREKGYVLWIGQLTHAPWVLRYLAKEPIPYEVRLLTRLKDDRGRSRAAALAEHLGIQCDITDHWIGPFRAFNWNEVVQNRMMRECKAALDIKGGAEDFSQWTKPATKAQKYVSSGIPVALNQDSYSAEYFRSRGFPLASPSEERWFTRAYWEETQAAARVLRPRLALEAVALRYRELFDKVLNGNCTEISAVASPITADNNAEKPASARFENKPAP